MRGRKPSRDKPLIQFWDVMDAPQGLAELVSDARQCEWIALIPVELAASDITEFLVGGKSESELVKEIPRADGSVLLAGRRRLARAAGAAAGTATSSREKRLDNRVR